MLQRSLHLRRVLIAAEPRDLTGVPLSAAALGGTPGLESFLMRLRSTRTAAQFAAALMAICAMAPGLRAAAAAPPNVLLLTLDTTRADALGAFGGREVHTPALDALAARGLRWTQAISSTPLTLPAHTMDARTIRGNPGHLEAR